MDALTVEYQPVKEGRREGLRREQGMWKESVTELTCIKQDSKFLFSEIHNFCM